MHSMGYNGVSEIDLMGDKVVMNLLRYTDPGFFVELDEEFKGRSNDSSPSIDTELGHRGVRGKRRL